MKKHISEILDALGLFVLLGMLFGCMPPLSLAHAQQWQTVSQAGGTYLKPSFPVGEFSIFNAPLGSTLYVDVNGHVAPVGSVVPAFAGTHMNDIVQNLLNGISPLTEFQYVQGNTQFATEGFVAGIAVPSSTTNYQTNASAFYATTSSTQNVVAGYFSCRVLVNNGKCWGINPVAIDIAGLTSGVVLTHEFDTQPQNAVSAYATGGIQSNLFAAMAGNFFNAYSVNAGETGKWAGGLACGDGAVGTGICVYLGQQTAGNSATSSQCALFRANAGSQNLDNRICADQFGDLVFTPPVNGGAAFENPSATSGTNNYYAPALKLISNEYTGSGWSPSIWSFGLNAPSTGINGYEFFRLQNSGSQAPATATGLEIPNEILIDTPSGGSSSIRSTSPSALNFTLPSASGQLTNSLTGATSTISGTSLSSSCDSGTVTVAGAVVGHPVAVSSTTGVDVGAAFVLRALVTSANTVTVYVCGTGTPSSLAYNVTVF